MATPRVVLVTRPSEYELLIAQHATASQARFFLETRGQSLDEVLERHHAFSRQQLVVRNAVPRKWRWAHVDRADLHQFLFEPGDVVAVLGQDGLVANVAKYLDGQRVLGFNPDQQLYDGVLVPFGVQDAAELFAGAAAGEVCCEHRTMVQAKLDDGQQLVAVNEIFIGHASHQSARYELAIRGHSEAQSSSGLVVTSGTGATGWARSIVLCRNSGACHLPTPEERRVAFFVREAFPSRTTRTELTEGSLPDSECLIITSRMNHGGVIFGDGIEQDCLLFDWGQRVRISVAQKQLHLVVPPSRVDRNRRQQLSA